MTTSLTLYMPDFSSVRVIQCSPPSWMIQLALHEKNLPYNLCTLDFAKGDHKTPEMLARNPRGTIPVLTDGARAIHETYAILDYLELAYPSTSLRPKELDAQTKAIMRLHESSNLKDAGMKLFVFLMRTPRNERALEALLTYKQDFFTELKYWERYLSQAPFVAGEQLTNADLSVYTYTETAAYLGLPLTNFPHLSAFLERMRLRPSVQATRPSTWASSPQDDLADNPST